MLKFLLSILLIITVNIVVAQRNIQGRIIGIPDNKPLPYANIGIKHAIIGTLSNEDGSFSIAIPENYAKDTLRFAALGFEEKSVPITQITGTSITISLNQASRQLKEVVITGNRQKPETAEYGNRYWQGPYGVVYADAVHAGAAMALLINPNTYPSYPESARVRLQKNSLGTCKIRLRLLHVDSLTGLPGTDLLHENVIIQTDINTGWLNVDLRPYHIKINNPFFLTVEWLMDDADRHRLMDQFNAYKAANPQDFHTASRMVNGQEIKDTVHNFHEGILLGASGIPFSLKNYTCYYRTNSFGEWRRCPYILTSRITLSNQQGANTPLKAVQEDDNATQQELGAIFNNTVK